MADVWPSSLPQYVLREGFSEAIGDGRLRSQPDKGPAKVRRRSSMMPKLQQARMIMSAGQLAILREFVSDTLMNGSLPFLMPDPITRYPALVRFAENLPAWTSRGIHFDVSFDLEVLYTMKPTTIIQDGRLLIGSCVRNSPAAYFDANRVLRWAAAHELRTAHDLVTAEPAALIESAATNLLRNPRAEGTTLGALNTANEPTYWDFTRTAGLGLTEEIVGVGQEDGIDYIDIKYSGVTAVAGTLVCSCENAVSVPAHPGQVMTISAFLRLLSGDISHATGRRLAIFEQRVGQGALTTGAIDFTTDARPLREQRKEFTFTVAHAETTHILPQPYRISFAAGAAVDFTIRVGLPQVEVGSRASSPIAPPAGTLGQWSRLADVVSAPTSAFPFNGNEGTLYAKVRLPDLPGGDRYAAAIHGNFNDAYWMRFRSGGVMNATVRSGGADSAYLSNAGYVAGSIAKVALSYRANRFAASFNGSAPVIDTSGALPMGAMTALAIGGREGGIGALNGRILDLDYHPRALSDGEIREMTT